MNKKWCVLCLAACLAVTGVTQVEANKWWNMVAESLVETFLGPSDDSYDTSSEPASSSYNSYTPSEAPGFPEQSEVARQMLDLANRERARVGAPPLHIDWALVDAANVRARELTTRFSHTRPDGSSCENTVPGRLLGENIGAGYPSVEAAFDGWMHSEGHRQNILRPEYTGFGAAVCYDPDTEYQYYWVQLFDLPKPAGW